MQSPYKASNQKAQSIPAWMVCSLSFLCALALSGVTMAHEVSAPDPTQPQTQPQAATPAKKPVKYFKSPQEAVKILEKATRKLFQEEDAKGMKVLQDYSSGPMPSYPTSLLKTAGIEPSKNLKYLSSRSGPVLGTALIYFIAYTPSQPVLIEYELYSANNKDWKLQNFQLTANLGNMQRMLKP